MNLWRWGSMMICTSTILHHCMYSNNVCYLSLLSLHLVVLFPDSTESTHRGKKYYVSVFLLKRRESCGVLIFLMIEVIKPHCNIYCLIVSSHLSSWYQFPFVHCHFTLCRCIVLFLRLVAASAELVSLQGTHTFTHFSRTGSIWHFFLRMRLRLSEFPTAVFLSCHFENVQIITWSCDSPLFWREQER